MNAGRQEHAARAVSLFKCDHCHGLHLRCEVNDRVDVIAVLDPDHWADLFMADEEFRREAALRLKAAT